MKIFKHLSVLKIGPNPHRRHFSSTFLYPDLSKFETEFIQNQIEHVLHPPSLESSKENHEIFPPKSRKFLVEKIQPVQEAFKDFKIPKRENELYIRNIVSLPKLDRTISALKWAKMDRFQLEKDPRMILMPPSEIFKMAKITECDEELSAYECINYSSRESVHGLFAIKYIKSTCLSLKILGFPEASKKIAKINFAKYDSLR